MRDSRAMVQPERRHLQNVGEQTDRGCRKRHEETDVLIHKALIFLPLFKTDLSEYMLLNLPVKDL